ncbi:hypothetical protein J1614_006251 [Plenodomus biglobosus]|nr:hypothetical protein J1614_006251 [Plenodomus biglobosus]
MSTPLRSSRQQYAAPCPNSLHPQTSPEIIANDTKQAASQVGPLTGRHFLTYCHSNSSTLPRLCLTIPSSSPWHWQPHASGPGVRYTGASEVFAATRQAQRDVTAYRRCHDAIT